MNINTISNEDIFAIISMNEVLENIDNIPAADLVLISISEPVTSKYKDEQLSDEICSLFKDYLKVKFWDVEEDIGNYTIIPDDVAKHIQDFIVKNKDQRFLVHCRAGQSRSAGVGKAIECIKHFGIGEVSKYNYKTGFSSDIDDNPRYSPNLTVFDKIIKEY